MTQQLASERKHSYSHKCLIVTPELLNRSWGTPPVGPNAHRSRSISDVSSFSTVSVLSFEPIRMRALCVEERRLEYSGYAMTPMSEMHQCQ